MKNLLKQNWPAFHTSIPTTHQPELTIRGKPKERLPPGLDTFHLKLFQACAAEFLPAYVSVKRWVLEVETLKTKDENVQRENMGLRVSRLESLTLLCPLSSCLVWASPPFTSLSLGHLLCKRRMLDLMILKFPPALNTPWLLSLEKVHEKSVETLK